MFVCENDKAVSVFNTRLISKDCNACGSKLIEVDGLMFFYVMADFFNRNW